ncbi:MAG: hypothetical protein K2X37_07840 [Chitinophagaceae bacterium]|nr:hypothetical protein [Chitinophagaceae bacterium]
MKTIICLLACIIFFGNVFSQPSISPSTNDEYCPDVEYTFTVTISKSYQSIIGIGSCYVTQAPSSPVGTTFTFKGKFGDANQKQTFRINYTDQTFTDFDFKKVKSLFYATHVLQYYPLYL